jgi:hypothetical protein
MRKINSLGQFLKISRIDFLTAISKAEIKSICKEKKLTLSKNARVEIITYFKI